MSQQAIKLQILSQLQAMGKRLDTMEQKSCKKGTDSSKIKNKSVKSKSKVKTQVTPSPSHQETTHIPDLQSIRQDAVLQAQFAKRLKELRYKIEIGGVVTYDQLSVTQWVAGFGSIKKKIRKLGNVC